MEIDTDGVETTTYTNKKAVHFVKERLIEKFYLIRSGGRVY
jgi:hypothetical protein